MAMQRDNDPVGGEGSEDGPFCLQMGGGVIALIVVVVVVAAYFLFFRR